MQQVAHHAVDHGFDRLVSEVEDDVAAALLLGGRDRGRLAHELLVATYQLALGRGFRLGLAAVDRGLFAGRVHGRALRTGALHRLMQQGLVRVEMLRECAAATEGNGGGQAEHGGAQGAREGIDQGVDS